MSDKMSLLNKIEATQKKTSTILDRIEAKLKTAPIKYKWHDEDLKTFKDYWDKNFSDIIILHEKHIGHSVKSAAQTCSRWVAQCKDDTHYKEVRGLESKIETLTKALEFYGNEDSWARVVNGKYNLGGIYIEKEYKDGSVYMDTEKGKRARKALAEIKELE